MKYIVPIVIIVLALLGANGLYVVTQGHAAIVTRFGHVAASGVGPGLHAKVPFAERVVIYDTRTIVLQGQPEDYKTAGGNPVRVGYYVRWRVADPRLYYDATAGNALKTTSQMTSAIRAELRKQVASHHLPALLASVGGSVDTALRDALAGPLRQRLGVAIVAVGIRRVMPPESALPAVYQRMNAGAKAEAGSIRAAGEAKAAAIRATGNGADQQLLAAANQAAATERGQGEVAAAKVYARASAQDPQFFRFWSTLDTWRKTFSKGGAVVVINKDSPFMQAIDTGAADGSAGKTH